MMIPENEEQKAQGSDAAPEQPPSIEEAQSAPEAGEAAEAGGEEVGAAAAIPAMSEGEIDEGKPFAILSYVLNLIGLPFFVIPLIMRNNDFALFHAKQCLMIWIAGAVGSAVGGVLCTICIGFVILPLVLLFVVVVSIMGIINSANGEAKPIPVIGQYAQEWFKGITKV